MITRFVEALLLERFRVTALALSFVWEEICQTDGEDDCDEILSHKQESYDTESQSSGMKLLKKFLSGYVNLLLIN